mmetsp:Transcript_2535/g.5776  ORF Transcript_2535/g.5776 Transcript_2535/m.5776 type:complete len:652 (+) Transcript_2535:1202-3157(+)
MMGEMHEHIVEVNVCLGESLVLLLAHEKGQDLVVRAVALLVQLRLVEQVAGRGVAALEVSFGLASNRGRPLLLHVGRQLPVRDLLELFLRDAGHGQETEPGLGKVLLLLMELRQPEDVVVPDVRHVREGVRDAHDGGLRRRRVGELQQPLLPNLDRPLEDRRQALHEHREGLHKLRPGPLTRRTGAGSRAPRRRPDPRSALGPSRQVRTAFNVLELVLVCVQGEEVEDPLHPALLLAGVQVRDQARHRDRERGLHPLQVLRGREVRAEQLVEGGDRALAELLRRPLAEEEQGPDDVRDQGLQVVDEEHVGAVLRNEEVQDVQRRSPLLDRLMGVHQARDQLQHARIQPDAPSHAQRVDQLLPEVEHVDQRPRDHPADDHGHPALELQDVPEVLAAGGGERVVAGRALPCAALAVDLRPALAERDALAPPFKPFPSGHRAQAQCVQAFEIAFQVVRSALEVLPSQLFRSRRRQDAVELDLILSLLKRWVLERPQTQLKHGQQVGKIIRVFVLPPKLSNLGVEVLENPQRTGKRVPKVELRGGRRERELIVLAVSPEGDDVFTDHLEHRGKEAHDLRLLLRILIPFVIVELTEQLHYNRDDLLPNGPLIRSEVYPDKLVENSQERISVQQGRYSLAGVPRWHLLLIFIAACIF